MLKCFSVIAAIAAVSIGVDADPGPWASSSRWTQYSCDGITGWTDSPGNAAAIAPLREVTARREAIDLSFLDRASAALTRSAREFAGAELTTADRVRLQHELIELADRVESARKGTAFPAYATEVFDRAMTYVQDIAPTAAEIAGLGAPEHPHVAGFLGAEIVERATRSCVSGRLFHAAAARGLLAYRPLRGPDRRALVAQLVAFDDHGAPHVTPLVDEIEIRHGDTTAAPACVVQAGDDGVLRPLALSAIGHDDRFVRRIEGGVGCAGCHPGGNSMNARDLPANELVAIDAARYGYVHQLATSTWARLTTK